MSNVLVIEESKCTACRVCELACSMRMEGEFNPAKSRIQLSIFDDHAFYMPIVCSQCVEAWCAEVCPSLAITRNEALGTVVVNPSRCVGCRICTMACPFGTILYDPDRGKVIKCEYCDGNPECVLFCPTGAITYKGTDTSVLGKRKALARKLFATKEAK